MGEKSVRIPIERIEKSIMLIRDEKVMIDRDLAELYGSRNKSAKSSRPAKQKKISARFHVSL